MDPEFLDDVKDWVARFWQLRKSHEDKMISNKEENTQKKIREPANAHSLPVRAPAAIGSSKSMANNTTDDNDDDMETTLPLCVADPWDEERKIQAEQIIRDQGAELTPFWQSKYKKEAGKFWHEFYKRNTDHFYKDRHYLHLEFPELLEKHDKDITYENRIQLLEVGCGVGNAVVPLLALNKNLYVNCIDFARSAINILRQHHVVTEYPGRLIANVCDVVNDDIPLPNEVQSNLDMILCLFVISAISFELQKQVFQKLANQLKIGGKLLFRDYGRYDEAQLRFKKGSKVQDNLYVRNDGTLAFYFELGELTAMCASVGLIAVENRCGYIRIAQANRQQGKARHRVFVQAVFEKVA